MRFFKIPEKSHHAVVVIKCGATTMAVRVLSHTTIAEFHNKGSFSDLQNVPIWDNSSIACIKTDITRFFIRSVVANRCGATTLVGRSLPHTTITALHDNGSFSDLHKVPMWDRSSTAEIKGYHGPPIPNQAHPWATSRGHRHVHPRPVLRLLYMCVVIYLSSFLAFTSHVKHIFIQRHVCILILPTAFLAWALKYCMIAFIAWYLVSLIFT